MMGLPNILKAPAALNLAVQAPSPAPATRLAFGAQHTQEPGWSRTQTIASSAHPNAAEGYRPIQRKFVRPDTDEAATDILAAFVSRSSSSPINTLNDPPNFRSALEQVSYETNSSRMQSLEPKSRIGQRILGRAARIFGK